MGYEADRIAAVRIARDKVMSGLSDTKADIAVVALLDAACCIVRATNRCDEVAALALLQAMIQVMLKQDRKT